MKNELGDKVRLLHILDAIGEIEKYLYHISYHQFIDNSEKRFATIKQIEIIGEACNALTETLKLQHPNVPWKVIKGLSIHEYFGVDFHIVWEIAQYDIPILKDQINRILEDLVKNGD